MKILYHHRTLGDGAEGIHVREMVQAFQELGHEVILTGPGVNDANKGKFEFLKQIVKGPLYEFMEIGYNFFGFYSINRLIKKFQPDFIYDRYMLFNYSAVAAGKKHNIPVFLEVNAPIALERLQEPEESLYLKSVAFKLEQQVCINSFRTLVVSTPLKKYLISRGVPENRIVVRPNGVNLKKFTPGSKNKSLLKELNIGHNAKVIGFTGVLRSWHGIDLLLKAFCLVKQKVPEVVLLLVGDGLVQKEIEKKCRAFGIDKSVIITGRVSHKKIKEYIDLFDVAVSPKTTFYASPMKIPEYMAMGKCVVAPDTENIRDFAANGKTCFLFEKDNSKSLAENLTKVLTDNQLNRKLSANALQHAQINLSWLNNARAVIAEFEKNGKNKE